MLQNFFLNQFFVGILKVDDENRRLVRGMDPGSPPICHGSATLTSRLLDTSDSLNFLPEYYA
jgi:hypothetical protein